MGYSKKPAESPTLLPEALDLGRIQQRLQLTPSPGRYWIAYSGGLDSQVLLHLLVKAGLNSALTAVHINHQLQAEAEHWEQHCRLQAQALGVSFRALKVDARAAPGESPEAAARDARYQALQSLMQPNDVLVTAQHQTDQAETLLLQLLRGAGPAGLAAMPLRKRFGPGWLLRPLLDVSRAEILAYAKAQGLPWIEDSSNAESRFDRNFLRHQVMPILRQRWPGAEKTLARSALLAGEAAELLTELAQEDFARVAEGGNLSLSKLTALSAQRQANLLRYCLKSLGLPLPSHAQMAQVLEQLASARPDTQICVSWPGCEIRCFRGWVYALAPSADFDTSQIIPWRAPDLPLQAVGIGQLEWIKSDDGGLAQQHLYDLSVRFRQGGERFHPVGRKHGQSLKKLLQEAAIPSWERDRLPLIYSGEQLIWVSGLGPHVDYAAPAGQAGMVLLWRTLA